MIKVFLALLLASCPIVAQDAADTDLSQRKVEIRYNFEGSDLILFGAVKDIDLAASGDGFDVIIVVRGPDSTTTIRRKARVSGIWMNRDAVTFRSVPGYYAISTTRPLDDFVDEAFLDTHGIGFRNLPLEATETDLMVAEFLDGLYRQRALSGLYREDEGAVEIVGTHLFRADIVLPSHTPVGTFNIDTFIVQNGEILGLSELTLEVDKAGFERAIYDYAHTWPLLYGLTAVLIAFGAGWLAGVVGKK